MISKCIVLPTDRETASQYAAICTSLKTSVTPIPANDIWIAALALQHNLPIVTRDSHFEKISSLHLLRWQ